MERKAATARTTAQVLGQKAERQRRVAHRPTIRGVNSDDVSHAFEEMKRVVNSLALHQEDKDLIVSEMAKKLTTWSVALEGGPIVP